MELPHLTSQRCFAFSPHLQSRKTFCSLLVYSSSELGCKHCKALLCVKCTAAAAVHTADRASDTADEQASSHVLSAARSALHCAAVSAARPAAAWKSCQPPAVALSNDCAQFSAQPAASNTAQASSLGMRDASPQYYTWDIPTRKSPSLFNLCSL